MSKNLTFILKIISILAFILSCFWSYNDFDFEPIIAVFVSFGALLGLFVSENNSKNKKEKVNPLIDITLEPFVDPHPNLRATKFWARLKVTNNSRESINLTPQIQLKSQAETYPLEYKQGFTEVSLNPLETKILNIATFTNSKEKSVVNKEEISLCFPARNKNKGYLSQKNYHEFDVVFSGVNLIPYSKKFILYVNEKGELNFNKTQKKVAKIEKKLENLKPDNKINIIQIPTDYEVTKYNPLFQEINRKEAVRNELLKYRDLQRGMQDYQENVKNSKGGCFPKGTQITTPTGLQDISILQKGDLISSFDKKNSQIEFRKILRKLSHASIRIWLLDFIDGSSIRTTSIHSFSVNGKWTTARQIKSGDSIAYIDANGNFNEKIVKTSSQTNKVEEVYNIIVEGEFNFIADGVLAHSFTYFRKFRILAWSIYGLLDLTPRLFEKLILSKSR